MQSEQVKMSLTRKPGKAAASNEEQLVSRRTKLQHWREQRQLLQERDESAAKPRWKSSWRGKDNKSSLLVKTKVQRAPAPATPPPSSPAPPKAGASGIPRPSASPYRKRKMPANVTGAGERPPSPRALIKAFFREGERPALAGSRADVSTPRGVLQEIRPEEPNAAMNAAGARGSLTLNPPGLRRCSRFPSLHAGSARSTSDVSTPSDVIRHTYGDESVVIDPHLVQPSSFSSSRSQSSSAGSARISSASSANVGGRATGRPSLASSSTSAPRSTATVGASCGPMGSPEMKEIGVQAEAMPGVGHAVVQVGEGRLLSDDELRETLRMVSEDLEAEVFHREVVKQEQEQLRRKLVVQHGEEMERLQRKLVAQHRDEIEWLRRKLVAQHGEEIERLRWEHAKEKVQRAPAPATPPPSSPAPPKAGRGVSAVGHTAPVGVARSKDQRRERQGDVFVTATYVFRDDAGGNERAIASKPLHLAVDRQPDTTTIATTNASACRKRRRVSPREDDSDIFGRG